jgi:hypothetical protein
VHISRDGPVTVLITGKDFTTAAIATWNSQTIPLTWQSSSQVTATFPASLLTSAVVSSLSLTDGSGTESSNAVPFEVLPVIGLTPRSRPSAPWARRWRGIPPAASST